VPRLNDADIARLLAGLGGQPIPAHDAPAAETASHEPPDEIAVLRARLTADERRAALRSALETALREYLQRDVTCSTSDDAPLPAEPLRFEGGEPLEWHFDLASPLAAALGDIVIGGDGANVRHTNRRRLGRLIEPLASRIAAVIAQAADAQEVPLRFVEVARRIATPLAGGSIEVGTTKGGWSAGATLRAPRALPSTVAASPAQTTTIPTRPSLRPEQPAEQPPSKPPRDVVHPVMEPQSPSSDARQQGIGPARERVIGPKPVEPDGAFAGAVAAACSRLGEITRCATATDAIVVTRVETPSFSRDDLKLALIAGGQGSLVLSADPEAVTSVAAATAGVQTPAGGKPGAVVVDAVEAVLRAALRGFAENLPGIAGGPQRFVRLAEGALPARSPHYAIAAPLHIGERAATLQWLVPTWMATAKGEERVPNDGR
jgi:hypothetical protein